MQSCLRRRLARRELKALKAEARSVSKFKEISYKLENKVVELTQTLQKRTAEKKELQTQLDELSQQLQHWMNRHEEADARTKQLQVDVNSAQEEISKRDELLRAKEDVEKRLEDALAKAVEKEDAIQKLANELRQQSAQFESQLKKALDVAPVRSVDDSIIATLKNEVNSLREQLNRANALNALTKNSRVEPLSPTFAPNLRLPDSNNSNATHSNGNTQILSASPSPRHQRRHSSAGIYNSTPSDNRTSADELMMMAKRNQAANPRAVSVAYNGDEAHYRGSGNLDDTYDDPAEEKIKLMQDVRHLDEDVLDGLIRGLKIPVPSLANPAAVKEILFPSNLISLITNEMWRYGLIQESERFLANVLQTVQAHVMVCVFFSVRIL
jgi:myosin V